MKQLLQNLKGFVMPSPPSRGARIETGMVAAEIGCDRVAPFTGGAD